MKRNQKITKNGYQMLGFPMEYMNITQGNNVGTHIGTNALDNAGKDAGIDPTFAPCDMHLVAYDSQANGNAVFFESNQPVLFRDGTVNYATFMFIHDNSISDIVSYANAGNTWKQGQEFGDEGTTGYATGNHVHMEVAKGKFQYMYARNGYGTYYLPNNVSADTAFVTDGTTIINRNTFINWASSDVIPDNKPKAQTTGTKYTNSSLVSYTKLSPNNSGQRTHSIDTITPHCVVGQCSVQSLGDVFAPSSRQASSNYGIGVDGKIGMYVEEKNRSWCSSSESNDQRAVTIECASDTTHPYTMNAKVYESLIALCVDICKRNGKTKLLWFNDRNKTLAYQPKSNEIVLTVHRWFANKSCPGDWLYSRLRDVANKVNERLNATTKQTQSTQNAQKSSANTLYRVRKSWNDTKSQKGAFKSLDNAKKRCNENVGYSVFDDKGKVVYTNTPKKSVDELAREVIKGKWGVGQDRVNKLTKAGYDYNAVQKRVNELLR